jgi:hypothetical protein
MEGGGDLKIKAHSVGLGRIDKTFEIQVKPTTTLKELYHIISDKSKVGLYYVQKDLGPLDLSKIGRRDFRTGNITSKHPDAKPTFVLDKTDENKSIVECGITDGAELTFWNGMCD